MMMGEFIRAAGLRGDWLPGEPLTRHTTWRCGGAADLAYRPADREDLVRFLAARPPGEPVTVIGLGSNLLVRDGGVRGIVVLMHPALDRFGFDAGEIQAEAGVASPKIARFAANHALAGAEFLAGIPGTIGGALAMNAGCYGGETWDHVTRVETIDGAGVVRVRPASDFNTGYRHVGLAGSPGLGGEWFLAGWFHFGPGDIGASRARIRELLTRRIATQPLNEPNAGSVFRNPPGDHAARLIDACGLKGFAIGGARVSEKHANFIVNPQRTARAADIEQLIAHVRAVVRDHTGIDLEPEVRVIGEAA